MCEHLKQLDNELKISGIPETFRGQAWSANCREWAYYDCYLVTDKLINRLHLEQYVQPHRNDDSRSGTEAGLVCYHCKDGIIGVHPDNAIGKIRFE